MKNIFAEIRVALLATIVLGIILCGVYPVLVWGFGQMLFHDQANGSLLYNDRGQIIGSSSLAQNFDAPEYFHPRPSAAGNGYDAANSSGSNLGPTSQKLIDQVKDRVEKYRQENNLSANQKIPGDAVTASASGLDPHISIDNAMFQAPRVAHERNISLTTVQSLVRDHTDNPQFGIFGDPGVNVLTLNVALDKMK